MKQKIMALMLTMVMCLSTILCMGYEVKAEDIGENIEFSELLTEEALIGYAQLTTRGAYLAEGYSIINKSSSTKIGAGGVTGATVKCEVSVCPIVERQVNGSWVRVTSWTVTNASAYSAMASKSITVATGYYYRVRCWHYAASDSSSSWTGALWM